MEIDLHGYHPEKISRNGLLTKSLQQAWGLVRIGARFQPARPMVPFPLGFITPARDRKFFSTIGPLRQQALSASCCYYVQIRRRYLIYLNVARRPKCHF
jgi:hypothetical protein